MAKIITKIITKKDINSDDWNYVLQNSKDSNITISPEYYDAHRGDYDFLRVLAYQNGKPIALLQGKIYRLKNIYFIKKLVVGSMAGDGIAVVNSKARIKSDVYKVFLDFAEKENLHVIELWTLGKIDLQGYISNEAYTIVVGLDCGLECIWLRLNKETRSSINKAQKNDVCVMIDSSPDLNKYYPLYIDTTKRGNFDALGFKHLQNATEMLIKSNILKVFAANLDGKLVSFAFVLCYLDTAYYWMGGSNSEGHGVSASNLMQWKIIEWASSNGYKSYNMWGADPTASSTSYGVYKFKIGFGGDLVQIHTYRKYVGRIARFLYMIKEYCLKLRNLSGNDVRISP